eukprot:scaffold4236_cov35-Attheya_sp.AAC.1
MTFRCTALLFSIATTNWQVATIDNKAIEKSMIRVIASFGADFGDADRGGGMSTADTTDHMT